MIGKKMLVRVLAGTVLASGIFGAVALHAGDTTTLPPADQAAQAKQLQESLRLLAAANTGPTTPVQVLPMQRAVPASGMWLGAPAPKEPEGVTLGKVVSATERFIIVDTGKKVETRAGRPATETFGFLVPLYSTLGGPISQLAPGDLVAVSWTKSDDPDDAARYVWQVTGGGTAIGVVSAKGADWIEISNPNPWDMGANRPQRFLPLWKGPPPDPSGAPTPVGSGFDKAGLKSIADRKIGDPVIVEWRMETWKRVLSIRANEGPKEMQGTLTGVITNKGFSWIEVGAEEAGKRAEERLTAAVPANAQPSGPGGALPFNQETLTKIRALNIGDKVTVDWSIPDRNKFAPNPKEIVQFK